jgi:LmbE family N-acetylglucosaminyl deacetylase
MSLFIKRNGTWGAGQITHAGAMSARLWRRGVLALLALLAHGPALLGQIPYSAGELQLSLQKLMVVGSVLYIGAHPDDENTAFLATMAKGNLYRTAYLSMTRGEGGQNLLGSEQGDALGLIRTQELLGARRIDGAEQYFTRAIDFGYSKSSDETLKFWGKEQILADVVWVIRTFRPDVIVTRFTPDRGGHGNHTASALLAYEAYRAAADPTCFPEQLRSVRPWKAKRIVWNVFRFSRSPGDQPTGSSVSLDLGQYSPLLGLSFGELSGMSRSMHKSQGFGALEQRGAWTNSFEHIAGDTARVDLFDGVETTWNRVKGGADVLRFLERALHDFEPARPSKIVPLLLDALKSLEAAPPDPWIEIKKSELRQVILACTGIWMEALGAEYRAVPGSKLSVTVRLINRSSEAVRLERVGVTFCASDTIVGLDAAPNVAREVTLEVTIPKDHSPTQPFWLKEARTAARYEVRDVNLVGLPQNAPELVARMTLSLQGRSLTYEVPVRYRWVDPTLGEQTRSLVVVPPVSITMQDRVLLSIKGAQCTASVVVSPVRPAFRGSVRLEVPQGWTSNPESQPVEWDSTTSDRTLTFRLSPGKGAVNGMVKAVVASEGRSYGHTISTISYPHIESQVFLEPAQSHVLLLDLEKAGARIGYITGSGDDILPLLARIGYRVDLLSDSDIETADLRAYDAIVAGVRAYNTRQALRASNERLLRYVADGGRYIVQYVTRQQSSNASIGPYPFTISNARVSVETAPVALLHPDHPLLRRPNVISSHDFDGWVQERGLYFASEWDARYETVLVSNDPGEEAQAGGLLFARYGKGYFIYTGYSWFRQLPAGVPGAFRLFVNLLSQDVGR